MRVNAILPVLFCRDAARRVSPRLVLVFVLPHFLPRSETGQAPSLRMKKFVRLLGAIPVHDLHLVPGLAQSRIYLFRDHHRAVLSTCASETNGQITFALMNVVRQQINQQLRDAINKFTRLGK